MFKLITFEEAIKQTEQCNRRHLLLGNGFSIACIPDIFSYQSILREANFSRHPELAKAFDVLGTADFEVVVNALERASKLLPLYARSTKRIASKMARQSRILKETLITTIASKHPSLPIDIPEKNYQHCLKFLSYFMAGEGRVYTLNYDLLLYWTLMKTLDVEKPIILPCDGFGKNMFYDESDVRVSDIVTWQGESLAYQQNVHYLHGALHLFDKGDELEKYTWINTGKPLIEQIRKALDSDKFPLFVAEGDSKNKKDRITHSGYLYHSYKSFSKTMQDSKESGCLFTYGVSFGDNDSHIFNLISQGKIKNVFVGIYGDPKSDSNKHIIKTMDKMIRQRRKYALNVTYYDSGTAKAWG